MRQSNRAKTDRTIPTTNTDRISCCLSEHGTIETIAKGAPETSFLHFGGRVRMEATDGPFGIIDQQVVGAFLEGGLEAALERSSI